MGAETPALDQLRWLVDAAYLSEQDVRWVVSPYGLLAAGREAVLSGDWGALDELRRSGLCLRLDDVTPDRAGFGAPVSARATALVAAAQLAGSVPLSLPTAVAALRALTSAFCPPGWQPWVEPAPESWPAELADDPGALIGWAHAVQPHPGLLVASDLVSFYRGELEPDREVPSGVLVLTSRGVAGELAGFRVVERAGPEGLALDVLRCPFTRVDASFAEALAAARAASNSGGLGVRWSVSGQAGPPAMIGGPSVGLGAAVALTCLCQHVPAPQRRDWAFTGGITVTGAVTGLLGPSGGLDAYRDKLVAAGNRAVVLPAVDHAAVHELVEHGNIAAELDPAATLREALAKAGVHPDASIRPVAAPAECPYLGLQAFQTRHAHLFFGRERLVDALVDQLRDERFVAVVGPSGSGKSSLAQAGLLPALAGGRVPGSQRWRVLLVRPGPRPLDELATQLASLVADEPAAPVHPIDFVDRLAASNDFLHTVTRMVPAAAIDPTFRVAVVVDQFEELFTVCDDDAQRDAFVGNLVAAATLPAGRTVVVLTVRADFYSRLFAYPELARLVSARDQPVFEFTEEELREAIVGPARWAGLELEDGLVEQILRDFQRDTGQLPLLEHALLQLWERRDGRRLTIAGYHASGGLAGSIAQRADQLLAELSPEQRELARRVFLRLVQPGEGTEDTRRRAVRSEVSRDADAVIDRLTQARLVTAGRDRATGQETLDVAHEALIRGWPQLRQWVEEDRAHLTARRRLHDRAEEWERNARHPDLLVRGLQLAEACHLEEERPDELAPLESDYVAASRRRHHRGRTLRAGFGAGLVVLVLGAGLVVWGGRASAARADRNASVALANQLTTDAARERDAGSRDRGLLLSLEALRRVGRLAPLQSLSDGISGTNKPVRTLARLTDYAYAADWSPDGRTAAVGDQGGIVTLIDVASGQTRRLDGHGDWIRRVRFSPDGRYLATTTQFYPPEQRNEGRVRLWDVASGQLVATSPPVLRPDGTEAWANGPTFTPDGAIVAGYTDGVVRQWRLTGDHLTLERAVPITTANPIADGPAVEEVDNVVLDRAGTTLAVVRSIRRLDAQGKATKAKFVLEARRWPSGELISSLPETIWNYGEVAFDPARPRIAYGSEDGNAWTWDPSQPYVSGDTFNLENNPLYLNGHGQFVIALAFSPSGRFVASGSIDRTIRVWDTWTNKTVQVLTGHEDWVWAVAFHGERELLSAAGDKTVRLWEVYPRDELAFAREDTKEAAAPHWSTDGRRFITSSNTGREVLVWDAATHQVLRRIPTTRPGGGLSDEAWQERLGDRDIIAADRAVLSPDGRRIAAADDDDVVRFYDVDTGQQVGPELRGAGDVLQTLAYRPDGTALAGSSLDGSLHVWDTGSGAVLTDLPGNTLRRMWLAWAPDGRHLLTVGGELPNVPAAERPTLEEWDAATWQPVARWQLGNAHVQSLAVAPGGDLVAVGDDVGTVTLWRIDTRVKVATLESATGGRVFGIAFSPDGRVLAVAGYDGAVRMWDVNAARLLGVAGGYETGGVQQADYPTAVAFSPDGSVLLRTSTDHSVRLVATPADWPALACAAAGRNLSQDEWNRFIGPTQRYVRDCPNFPSGPGAPTDAPAAELGQRVATALRSGSVSTH